MKSLDFCYWLRGFLEVADKDGLSARHVDKIKETLNIVLGQEDGRGGTSDPNAHVAFLPDDPNP